MSDFNLDRRGLVTGAALIGLSSFVAAQDAVAAADSLFAPTQLPFDPASIAGLSEKLLTSHHDNNYVGAVKRLGAIETEIGALDPSTSPGYRLNGLKREELLAWNSMILHEIYFAGLGAPSQPGAKLAAAIENDFGGVNRWRTQFVAMGEALGADRAGSCLPGAIVIGGSSTNGRRITACRWPARRPSWCWTCTSMPTPSTMGRRRQPMSRPS